MPFLFLTLLDTLYDCTTVPTRGSLLSPLRLAVSLVKLFALEMRSHLYRGDGNGWL